jgi:hypothetical protein
MTAPREFVCTDCGADVVVFNEHAANDEPICLTCSWLRVNIPDPEKRKKLREWLDQIRKEAR